MLTAVFSGDLTKVREHLEQIPEFKHSWFRFVQRHAVVLREADFWVKRLEHERSRAVQLGGNRWYRFGNSVRDLAEKLMNVAAIRVVTQDSSDVNTEVRLARIIFSEPEWRAQGRLIDPQWHADLWTGDLARHMSLWLAWSQSVLNQTDLKEFRVALKTRAVTPIMTEWVDPLTRIHALDSMGHNWWSVVVSGAGIAALIVDDTETTRRVRDCLVSWLEYPGNILQNKTRTFGRDGGFVETPSYADYALENYLYFAFALYEATGDKKLLTHEVLYGLPDWYLAHLYPFPPTKGWRYVNFGDGNQIPNRMGVWLGLARALGEPRLVTAFHAANRPPGTLGEFLWYAPLQRGLDAKTRASTAPDNASASAVNEKTSESAIFRDAGCAFLRGQGGEHLLAIRSGEVWNHNHLDTGTFIFYSGGKGWILDPGMESYSRPEYRQYLVTPHAHNVILRNREGVPHPLRYEGTRVNGDFPVFWQKDSYRYLLVDATGPYEGVFRRFYRHVLWLDGVGVLIVDDVSVPEPSKLTYLIHPKGELRSAGIRSTESDETSAGRFLIWQGSDARSFSLYCSTEVAKSDHLGIIVEPDTKVDEDAPLPTMPYYAFETTTEQSRVKFVTFLGFSSAPTTQFLRLAPTLLQAQVMRGKRLWTVWINEAADGRLMHRNSAQSWSDVRTDALLVVHESSLNQTFLHNGSYLRQGSRSLFESWIKVDAALASSPLRSPSRGSSEGDSTDAT